MITLVYIDNPLKPSERHIEYVRSRSFKEWAKKKWPDGDVKGNLTVVADGYKVQDYEKLTFSGGMHVLVIRQPVFPGISLVTLILQALVGIVVSLIISDIFRPKKPTAIAEQPSASPVYSITGSQNAARVGEPVPVGYGEFIQVPDFGSQPYTEFVDNEMYLNEILVIGQGEYDILEMFVGESSVDNITPGVIIYYVYGPSLHHQTMGVIEDSTSILENVATSPEVGDQELSSGSPYVIPPDIYWRAFDVYFNATPNFAVQTQEWLLTHGSETVGTIYSCQIGFEVVAEEVIPQWVDVIATAYVPPPHPDGSIVPNGTLFVPPPGSTAVGWFEACKPGARGDRLMLDFIFPGGLYEASTTTGELAPKGVEIKIEYQRISDSGSPLGLPSLVNNVFVASTNTPQRYTLKYDIPAWRYRVRVTRITANATTTNVVDKIVWFGLKLKIVRTPPTIPIYGETTLVAVRMRATNGVASSATSRIRFRVRRLLPILGSGPPLRTRNPADVFIDIMTAPYGADRPLDEVDLPALTACHASWGAHNGFNGVFAQKSTVFESLSVALQVVAAGPLPVGQRMSVQVDSVKNTRIAMFNEANLNGLTVGYEFDKIGSPAGIRVEYRDPLSFTPAFVTLPPDETNVDVVSLFGCADRTTATQYAQLMLNRRALQRKTVQFDTEMEGFTLLPGERIAVQHQMPHWGQVGIVQEYILGEGGSTVWLQDDLRVDRDPAGTIADRQPDITNNDFFWRASGDDTLTIVDGVGAGAYGTSQDLVQFLTGADLDDPFVPLGLNQLPWFSTLIMRGRARSPNGTSANFQEWRYFLDSTGNNYLIFGWDPGAGGGYLGYVLDGIGEDQKLIGAGIAASAIGILRLDITVTPSAFSVFATFTTETVDTESDSYGVDLSAFDDFFGARLEAPSGDTNHIVAQYIDVFTGGAETGATLILDRKLNWTIPGPHHVMLSSEINSVSDPIPVTQGGQDHIVVLASTPFDIFGKGDHQEPTRVSFGTMGLLVRDWIVLSANPSSETAVRVEGITYNPDIYIGAMPHQLFEPGTGVVAGFDNWILAGTPASPSIDYVLAGKPATAPPIFVVAGTPEDPSAE